MTKAYIAEDIQMKNREKAVYLDVCALGRPYDDHRIMRIGIEINAVQLIIAVIRAGRFFMYYSPVHIHEIGRNPDDVIRADLMALLYGIGRNIKPLIKPETLEQRARSLMKAGVGAGDAFHIAHAEQAEASFVTCDDRLLKKYRALGNKVWCGTPVEFCEKERLI